MTYTITNTNHEQGPIAAMIFSSVTTLDELSNEGNKSCMHGWDQEFLFSKIPALFSIIGSAQITQINFFLRLNLRIRAKMFLSSLKENESDKLAKS